MRALLKIFGAVFIGLALVTLLPGACTCEEFISARREMWRANAAAEQAVEQDRHGPAADAIRQHAKEAMDRYVLAAKRWHDTLMASNSN